MPDSSMLRIAVTKLATNKGAYLMCVLAFLLVCSRSEAGIDQTVTMYTTCVGPADKCDIVCTNSGWQASDHDIVFQNGCNHWKTHQPYTGEHVYWFYLATPALQAIIALCGKEDKYDPSCKSDFVGDSSCQNVVFFEGQAQPAGIPKNSTPGQTLYLRWTLNVSGNGVPIAQNCSYQWSVQLRDYTIIGNHPVPPSQ